MKHSRFAFLASFALLLTTVTLSATPSVAYDGAARSLNTYFNVVFSDQTPFTLSHLQAIRNLPAVQDHLTENADCSACRDLDFYSYCAMGEGDGVTSTMSVSIKVGKDADVVLWTDHPLSMYANVEKTIVDGVVYFDIEKDEQARAALLAERARLIQKMKGVKKNGGRTQKGGSRIFLEFHCDEDRTHYDVDALNR